MKFYEIAAKNGNAYDLSPRARSEVAVTGELTNYMRPRSPKSASDGSDFPGSFGAADSTGDWK